MKRRSFYSLAVLVGTLTAIAALLAVAVLLAGSSENTRICTQINRVQGEIHGVIERQSQGLSSNQFFAGHPDALLKAEAEVGRDLATFAPLKC